MAPFKYVFRKFWIWARRLLLLGGPLQIGGVILGNFFQKIGEDMREYQKTQYLQEETMGEFFQKFREGMREYLAGGKRKGNFFQKFGEDMREFEKVGGHWGNFSKNLEKICANFQKEYWREETMGEFFQKFGEDMCEFPKNNIGGRKLWGIVPEIGEDMCEFQKETILEGGNNGGIFRGIRRRYARISKQ